MELVHGNLKMNGLLLMLVVMLFGLNLDQMHLLLLQTYVWIQRMYTLSLIDSFGDGWNGNILNIAGTEFTLNAGSNGTFLYNCPVPCNFTELPVYVSNGDETYFAFMITDYDGQVVATGGNSFDGVGCFDLDNNCYDVTLSSGSGNGDEGATLTVGDQTFTWSGNSSWYSNNYEAFGDYCETDYCFEESFDNVTWNGGSWGTWSGTDSDAATVADGVMTLEYGDDVVSSLPTFSSGVFEVSFDLNVLTSGYFNFGNSGNTSAWDWENEFLFNADGTASDDFFNTWSFTPGQPMDVSTFIDLDNGVAVLVIDGEWVAEWNWTGNLGGVGFFPNSEDSQFTVDNFSMCEGEMPFISGCTDINACNYDADATIECNCCNYADSGYDCDGNCLNDLNNNGICDELEEIVFGCTDIFACNFDDLATDDDGSCWYAEDCEK